MNGHRHHDAEQGADDEVEPLLPKCKSPARESKVPWLEELHTEYGTQLLWLIVAGMWVIKGLIGAVEGLAAPFVIKEYNTPAAQIQIYQALSSLPWSMKPIFGLLSDTLPIGGYNKFPYAIAFSALGLASMGAIGTTSTASMSIWSFVICHCFSAAYQASITVFIQGTYSAKLQQTADVRVRSNLVAFDHSGQIVFGSLGALLVGLLLYYFDARKAFLVILVPAAVVTALVLKVFLDEGRKDPDEVAECRERVRKQPELMVLCGLLLAANLVTFLTTMFTEHPVVNGLVAVGVTLTLLVALALLLAPVAAGVAIFIMAVTMVSFTYDGALIYFCTNNVLQYPAGPHISPLFYTAVRQPMGAVFGLSGVLMFARVSNGWTYRQWYLAVISAMFFTQFPGVMLLMRTNVAMGIDDRLWLIVAQASDSFTMTWVSMPAMLAFSTLCPRGLEATVFGILIGLQNIADSASGSLGGLVLYAAGVNPSGARNEAAQFEKFWLVAIIQPVVTLCVALLLSPLLPDKVMGESLIDSTDSGSITSGSLWKRWKAGDTGAQSHLSNDVAYRGS